MNYYKEATVRKKSILFLLTGIFILFNNVTSFAMTPPPTEKMVEALRGDNKTNFDESRDVYFTYTDTPINKIKSEDELKKLVKKANDDELDAGSGEWIVVQWQPQEGQYFERVLLYDKKGELYEGGGFMLDNKSDTTTALMSELLGEEYNANMKNILLGTAERKTPFGYGLLVKVFDDGSVKIGVLADVEMSETSIKRGWYSLDEIKNFIKIWKSDGEDYVFRDNLIRITLSIFIFIIAAVTARYIAYRKTKKEN